MIKRTEFLLVAAAVVCLAAAKSHALVACNVGGAVVYCQSCGAPGCHDELKPVGTKGDAASPRPKPAAVALPPAVRGCGKPPVSCRADHQCVSGKCVPKKRP